jgi:UDP-glucose 4-epimerase
LKNVLVTGACGRIGDSMCSGLLKKDFSVIAMDNDLSEHNKGKENFTFVSCKDGITPTLKSIFEDYKIDAVVHLACTADNDMGFTFTEEEAKISEEYDKNIYSMAIKANVSHLVLISTSQVYQKVKSREPLREVDSFIKPVTNYGKMKLASERALIAESKNNKETAIAIARVPQVYSLDLYENLVTKILDPKNGMYFIYRKGEYGFQMCCIHNLVDFTVSYIRQADGKSSSDIFNVCDKDLTTASDIINFMKTHHRIGIVEKRSEPKETPISKIMSKIVSNDEKTNYRYLDFDTILSNIAIDNRKATKFCPFKWNINNTK